MAVALIGIHRRQRWVILMTYERLMQIEWQRGMRKHIYLDVLDHWSNSAHWDKLSQAEQDALSALRRQHPRPRLYGTTTIHLAAGLAGFGWLALVLAELSIVLWNSAHG
jgi:hypothetical protein